MLNHAKSNLANYYNRKVIIIFFEILLTNNAIELRKLKKKAKTKT